MNPRKAARELAICIGVLIALMPPAVLLILFLAAEVSK